MFKSAFSLYLAIFSVTATLLLLAILTLNYLIDPYQLYSWQPDRIGKKVYPGGKMNVWSKLNALSVYKPDVLYIGSSRTEVGLPAQHSAFAKQRVFNAGISGGSLGDAIAMLDYSNAIHVPKTVVWGLDYGEMFFDGVGNTDVDRQLLKQSDYFKVRRFLLAVQQALSMTMTSDTLKELKGLDENACGSSLAFYGQRDPACMSNPNGMAKAIEWSIKKEARRKIPNIAVSLEKFDAVMQHNCQQKVAFFLYISPIHALATDMFYWNGQWDKVENWKRALVQITERHKQTGCAIRLVDFSGFNRITSEAIPQQSGKDTMQYYWEASHFRGEVGYDILSRLFEAHSDTDFGVELNAHIIEAHTLQTREQRDNYHQTHPQEINLLKTWLRDVAN